MKLEKPGWIGLVLYYNDLEKLGFEWLSLASRRGGEAAAARRAKVPPRVARAAASHRHPLRTTWTRPSAARKVGIKFYNTPWIKVRQSRDRSPILNWWEMRIWDYKILFRSSLNKWINGSAMSGYEPELTVGSQVLGRLGSDSRTNIHGNVNKYYFTTIVKGKTIQSIPLLPNQQHRESNCPFCTPQYDMGSMVLMPRGLPIAPGSLPLRLAPRVQQAYQP